MSLFRRLPFRSGFVYAFISAILAFMPLEIVWAACPASFPVTVPAGDTARLIEVITCANGTLANDVINLTSGSTYTLTVVNTNSTGLPPIVTAATAGTLTINGNGATIARSSAGGTPNF